MKTRANLSVQELRRALSVRERIESLEQELQKLLTSPNHKTRPDLPPKGKRGMSAAGRASVAAAMKARWRKAKKAGRNSL